MNAADVLASSLAPGTDRVYFLGCFESRVTVYAQQVRALNLASALVSEGKIRSTGKIAIVGGGAAGMTTAAALIALCPALQKLVLFERKSDLLHMQMQSRDRYLHPHIYDWPRGGSLESKAGLPVLDWEAGPADVVAKTLGSRFRPFQDVPCVEVRTSTSVTGVSILGSGCRIRLENDKVDPTVFDAAVLCVGFGYERFTELGQPSYWDTSALIQPIRNDLVDPQIFVSGNGDGALVDFSLAAYRHISHEHLCQFVVGRTDLEAAKAALLAIEAEAEAQGDGYDIRAAYNARVSGLVPNGMWLDVHERLRTDAKVRFHSRSEKLFRRDTSILNRFMAYLAIRSDEIDNTDSRRIMVTTGKPLLNPEWRADGSIHIQDEPAFTSFSRFLRFGADSDKVLSPFEALAHDAKIAHAGLPNTHAVATPALTDSAKTLFENLKQDTRFVRLTSIQTETETIRAATQWLEFRRVGDQIRWSGDRNAISSAWDAQRLEIRCDFLPRVTPWLSIALFRLLAHAENSALGSPDKNEWQRAWKDTMSPGPSPYTRYGNPTFNSVDSAIHLVNTPELASEIDLASRVNECLDQVTLVRLDRLVVACLDDVAPQPFGWDVAQQLREELQERWSAWLTLLKADSLVLRRFLILMAAEKDGAHLPDHALLRVGKHTLQSTILRSTLFSLHVAEALPNSLSPDAQFPGNLASTIFRAHACGVSWINGIDIGSSYKKATWNSRLVLLSELQSPSVLANRYVPRLIESEDETPSLISDSPLEAPIVIGSDDSFRSAASSGKQRLESHFASIFTQLTAAAENSLEK
jgi:hypothetical protein